ncbi:efflux RND transporter periplasmic adaptor subunit [Sphingorhabdus sp. Alg231-15]|uniref:efflux RND transporter periplasmic adaptor subunit n=1 Tax=Sphingorhabdus sp. Alg231-15 TaxID=1922222 RepID=UPI000D55F351
MNSLNKRQIMTAVAIIAAVLALAVLSVQLGLFGNSELKAAKPLRVSTQVAQQEKSLAITRSFAGRIEAHREAAAGFELGGLINAVSVEEGQKIRKGSPMAKLDTDILRARRSELIAARNRAAADRDLARSTFNRLKAAIVRDAVSQQAVDEAARTIRAGEAALAQSNAAIRSLNVQIRKSVLRAPFNAVVVSRLVDEGTVVASGTPVLNLLEDGLFDARFGLTGPAADTLQRGRQATIRVGNKQMVGVVKSVLPLKDRNSRSVDVIVKLPEQDPSIRHGDLARLDVPFEREETGIWLPLTALTENSRGIWAAYVAKQDSKGMIRLERRQLQIIHQETDRVFVRGTLKAGDRVVTGGLQRLSPGQVVELAKPSTANHTSNGGLIDG